jgi:hypothetical protein
MVSTPKSHRVCPHPASPSRSIKLLITWLPAKRSRSLRAEAHFGNVRTLLQKRYQLSLSRGTDSGPQPAATRRHIIAICGQNARKFQRISCCRQGLNWIEMPGRDQSEQGRESPARPPFVTLDDCIRLAEELPAQLGQLGVQKYPLDVHKGVRVAVTTEI